MKDIPIRNIEETQVKTTLDKAFNIRRLKDMRVGSGLAQPLHRHDFYYMLAVEKGEGSHSIDFQEYQVVDYSIYFMRPGQVHEHHIKAGCKGYLMAFQTGFYPYGNILEEKNGLRKAGRKNCYSLSKCEFEMLKTIFESMNSEIENKKKQYESVIRSYLNILISSLNRIGSPGEFDKKHSYFVERLEELEDLIESDIAVSKSVSHYAKKMNLTTYQLNSISKKLLGRSVSTIISGHLILEAKRLLLGTTKQINEIGYELGFDDSPYFIRFFKKHTGLTPNAMRKSFGK